MICPRLSPRSEIRLTYATPIFLFSTSIDAEEAPPHRFLVIGASMLEKLAGTDLESFWISLALDFPVLSDIGIGETRPMKAFALPTVKIRGQDTRLLDEKFLLPTTGTPVRTDPE